jgi:hypothetical protein
MNDTGLTDNQLMQLGRIAFWAARCEVELTNVIVRLMAPQPDDDEELIRGLVRGAGWTENVARLRWLLGYLSLEDTEYITACLNQATSVMGQRNHLLHGTWVGAADGFAVFQERRGKPDKVVGFRDAEACASADALSAAADQLIAAAMVAEGVIGPELIDMFRRDNGGRVFPVPGVPGGGEQG